VLGFRFGNVAYCTDTNFIPDESWKQLEGLDTLVLDCLRITKHPTHFCMEEALAVVERLKPKKNLSNSRLARVGLSPNKCHVTGTC
jgi:phosphoribosyl 1,2-cyclic phosphate phosphodiesterase